jgi:hypothetical protein
MAKMTEPGAAEGITSCLGEDSTSDATEQSDDGASETISGDSLAKVRQRCVEAIQ